MKKKLFFHLNLDFSSIEESERLAVINSSYVPLFELRHSYEIYFEATISTLRSIQELEPSFFGRVSLYFKSNQRQFIGSGFYQIIHDCYSDDVFERNVEKAKNEYNQLLGFVPEIWLANEMVFSRRLLRLYAKYGIAKLMVDKRSLPSVYHSYSELLISDLDLTLVFADSLNWQLLQDVTTGSQKTEFLTLKRSFKSHEFIYSGDAEHFGVNLARFDHEIPQFGADRVDLLVSFLEKIEIEYEPVQSERINLADFTKAIYVKKQIKYNVSRWLIGGKYDNQYLNAFIVSNERAALSEYMSDMRTHWTKNKATSWNKFKDYHTYIIKKSSNDEVLHTGITNLPVFKGVAKWQHQDYSEAANFYPVSAVYSMDLSVINMVVPGEIRADNSSFYIERRNKTSYALKVVLALSSNPILIRPFIFSLNVSNKIYANLMFSFDKTEWFYVKDNDEQLRYPNLFNYEWISNTHTGDIYIKNLESFILKFSYDPKECWYALLFTSKSINSDLKLVQLNFSVREPNRIHREDYMNDINNAKSFLVNLEYIEN